MNIAMITESKHVARKKYVEYRRAVKERHNVEYAALSKAYREIIRGRQIIDIVDVMRTAGLDFFCRPKLAICRADARRCYFWFNGSWPVFSLEPTHYSRKNEASTKRVRLPDTTFTRPPQGFPQQHHLGSAIVPSIPPSLMPAGRLDRYHILWEAEWEKPPVDPILLRHMGRNLYCVIAQWDLTPLERAVLQPMPVAN